MEKDHETLYALIISQLLHDGFTDSAQHLASSLVSLSTVTQCVSSNQLLDIYKAQLNEEEKAPIILMIEDESGKTTQVEVPGGLQIDNQSKSGEMQEETMATEESAATMESSESFDVYTTTAVVATGDEHRHGNTMYVSDISANAPAEEQVVSLVQPTDSLNVTAMDKPMKRKRTDDEAEILDRFGEFGPSDPSEDESDGEANKTKTSSDAKQETKDFEESVDGYSCGVCGSKYNMEIMLKLHMAAAHPNVAHHVFEKGEFKRMRTQRKRDRETLTPRQQKIECIYCDKSFTVLKFAAHVATSGHRRNLALKKGQKTTLDTLQEMAAASKSSINVKTEPHGLPPEGAVPNTTEEGSTEQHASAEPTGCVYSSTISCFRCKSKVARDKFLKEHLRVCARKIYCEVCCKLFELGRASEHHDQKCLPSIPYRCSNCGKGHVKLTALEHHVSQCKASAKFLCNHCYRCFDTFLECKVHESDEQTVYRCALCEETFSTVTGLNEHETEHKENQGQEGEGEKGDISEPQTNESPPEGADGEKKQEVKKPPFMCTTCGMGFKHKSSLEVHEYSHKDERRFMCDECGRSYKYQTSLKNHIYTHLKDEAKPHQCRFCGKRFSSAGAVKVHIRKHTGHKPYKCSVCDKTFTQLGPLKAHSRLHSGEKPLVCTFCNYDFSSHGSLSAHLKSVHKRKPFYCSNCDKGFNTESALKKHLPSHGIDAGTTVIIETVETQV